MNEIFDLNESSRRNFLKSITALPLLSMLNGKTGRELVGASTAPPISPAKNGKPFVAIQVGARSFVDEGVDGVVAHE